MGVITDTLWLRQLQGQKIDLDFKIKEIMITKANLTHSGDDLMKVGTDYDPDSPVMKTLQLRREKLKMLEQKLDQQLEEYKIELDIVTAQYNSYKQSLKNSINEEFSMG